MPTPFIVGLRLRLHDAATEGRIVGVDALHAGMALGYASRLEEIVERLESSFIPALSEFLGLSLDEGYSAEEILLAVKRLKARVDALEKQ